MNTIIILSSLIIAGFVFLYFVLKRQLRKMADPSVLYTEIKREVDQMIVELNRTTENNIGLLEDKINTLSDLLSRADKRIVLLQRESEKLALSKTYNHLIQQAKPPAPAEPEKPEKKEAPSEPSLQNKVLQLSREGISKNIIASRLNMAIGEVELIISLNEAGQTTAHSVK